MVLDQQWKYAILTNFFYRIRIYSFVTISFRIWKNLVHTQGNSDAIARWSSLKIPEASEKAGLEWSCEAIFRNV
jgi:hypothetical protein